MSNTKHNLWGGGGVINDKDEEKIYFGSCETPFKE